MNPTQYWKNFDMNAELHAAGAFIYNGLLFLEKMDNLECTDEVFEVLYSLSVGMERVLKIGIVLLEDNSKQSQENLEKSLVSHNHIRLVNRIRNSTTLHLCASENQLLECLGSFYKKSRYDRYHLKVNGESDLETAYFKTYIKNQLGDIFNKDMDRLIPSYNMDDVRRAIGSPVRSICKQLYSIINKEAMRQNLYTYEIRNDSKAFKIFIRNDTSFIKERVARNELILFIAANGSDTILGNIAKRVGTLDFDPGEIPDLIDAFTNEIKCQSLYDSVSEMYHESTNAFDEDRHDLIQNLRDQLGYIDFEDEV
jgi:hypothetical protein